MALFSHLIPVPHFQRGFTTNAFIHTHVQPDSAIGLDAAGFSSSPFEIKPLEYVGLTDEKALGVYKISSRTAHPLVPPPPLGSVSKVSKGQSVPSDSRAVCRNDGASSLTRSMTTSSPLALPPPELAWEAFYPKGSINPSAEIPGGFGFYLAGTRRFSDSLSNAATEIVMSYRMMLEAEWEWGKGGKLPGIFGGIENLAYACSGGRKGNRDACFDIRLMWRSEGVGELYIYLPLNQDNRDRLLSVPPLSLENADYGFSVGRGAFSIPVGRWMSVAIRVKLNDVENKDGEIELYVDGTSVISAAGLILRPTKESKLKGMHFQTFFGGNKPDWASPKDQRAWFADVTGVVVN